MAVVNSEKIPADQWAGATATFSAVLVALLEDQVRQINDSRLWTIDQVGRIGSRHNEQPSL